MLRKISGKYCRIWFKIITPGFGPADAYPAITTVAP